MNFALHKLCLNKPDSKVQLVYFNTYTPLLLRLSSPAPWIWIHFPPIFKTSSFSFIKLTTEVFLRQHNLLCYRRQLELMAVFINDASHIPHSSISANIEQLLKVMWCHIKQEANSNPQCCDFHMTAWRWVTR